MVKNYWQLAATRESVNANKNKEGKCSRVSKKKRDGKKSVALLTRSTTNRLAVTGSNRGREKKSGQK